MLTVLLTVVLACYYFVFKHFGVISENYSTPGMLTWILNHQRPIARMGANAALIMVYLGLFVLPVIDFRKRADVWHVGLTAVLFGVTFTRFPMDWSGNLLYGWGIGPVEVTGGSAFVAPFPWMAHLLRLLGAYGGAVLLVTLFKKLFSSATPMFVRWGIVMSGGYLFFLVINQFLFDRYLLMLVPFALYAVAWEGAPKHVENRVFLVLMALYSIFGTRNYLDWNRDRWDAVRTLQDKGVSPAEIDGGFEVNGWFQQKHLEPAEWVIGFNKPDGYLLEQRFSSGVCIFRKITSDSGLQH